MASSYLEIAERIISVRGRPLTAKEILRDAENYGLLPNYLSGETMFKTLQARITEDITLNREESVFYRTRIGQYFLRSMANDSTIPKEQRAEIVTRGRSRPSAVGRILYLPCGLRMFDAKLASSEEFLRILGEYGEYADDPIKIKGSLSVGTFSVIQSGEYCFIHVVGRHSPFRDAVGKTSIGLRRYVDEYDRDLFSKDDFGIDISAAKEVLRNVDQKQIGLYIDDQRIRKTARSNFTLIDFELRAAWIILVFDVDRIELELFQTKRRLDITKSSWARIDEVDDVSLDRVSKAIIREQIVP